MPIYQNDMMLCAQDQCKLKDQCYRYWLGLEIKNHDFQYATFFHPEKEVTDGCSYFINKDYFE